MRMHRNRNPKRWLPSKTILTLAIAAITGTTTVMAARAADAGAEDDAVVQLPTLVVESSPIVSELQYGIFSDKIATVTAAQVQALAANDLADALRMVPGVSIARFNMVGAYGGSEGGSFTIRGHGWGRPGSGVSTRVNGVARFNGIWTHPLLDSLSIDMAEKISVYKSPQPVLMGNMAFAAVNLEPTRHRQEQAATRLRLEYGSYATQIYKLEHGGRLGALDYHLGGVHRASDGHRTNADGAVSALHAHLGYTLSPFWEATLLLSHSESSASDPRAKGAAPLPITEKYKTDTQFYTFKLAHDYGDYHGQVLIYFEDGWAKWQQWDAGSAQRKNHFPLWDTYGVHIRENFHLWPGNTTSIGFDYDVVRSDVRDVFPATGVTANRLQKEFSSLAPYVLLAQQFDLGFAQLTPSAGIRWTNSRYFADKFSYQAGVTAQRGSSELYANVAHAVNYPGIYAAMFYENYWPFLGNPGGWKNIEPETMDHWEIGLRQSLGHAALIDLSYYSATVKNAIRLHTPPPPPPRWENIGTYTCDGIELNLELTPLANLKLFTGLNYLHTSGANVPRAPKWNGNFGVIYKPTPRISLHLDAQYTSRQYTTNTRNSGLLQAAAPAEVDAFTLVNAKISYAISAPDRGWSGSVFAGVKNLTNTTYEYQVGYPMPGITGYSGIELQF